jgi:hypothetical protein
VTDPHAVTIDRCPLCGGTAATEHSTPEANLYSEKLAELLGQDDRTVLREHANWRCDDCGLVFKRRWFAPDGARSLHGGGLPADGGILGHGHRLRGRARRAAR